jgi:hypothetical protein
MAGTVREDPCLPGGLSSPRSRNRPYQRVDKVGRYACRYNILWQRDHVSHKKAVPIPGRRHFVNGLLSLLHPMRGLNSPLTKSALV